MRLRHTSIRTRVFLLVLVPLAATIGIYGYAVVGQFGTAVGLANAGKLSGATIDPIAKATQALAAERDAAVYDLVVPSDQAKAALQKQEAVTDKAAGSSWALVSRGRSLPTRQRWRRARQRSSCGTSAR